MGTEPNGEEPVIRPFAAFLLDHHAGRTAEKLAEELHALVAAGQDTEKGGSLTLTLKVEPLAKGDIETLIVTADIKTKLPVHANKGAVFFPDAHGNLVRESPDKPRLPLREVGGKKIAELNDAGEPIEATSAVRTT